MEGSPWISALAGLIGALIGSGATLLGQRLTIAQQRRHAAATRDQHLLDRQYQAAAAYLARADLLLDEMREMCRVLSAPEPKGGAAEVHERYLARWGEWVASRAALRMAATQPVLDAGSALRGAVENLAGVTDDWYRGGRSPRGANSWQSAYEAALAARESFADAAKVATAGADIGADPVIATTGR